MQSHYLELTRPEHAYLFGFIQADGHLSYNPRCPNKGKLQIELSSRDEDLLHKLSSVIPVKTTISSRVRITNFSKGELSQTYTLSACDMSFRQELERLGVPRGKKSTLISPPLCDHSIVDYYRGIIDGDGSLGVVSGGRPFISLVTASDPLKAGYTAFIKDVTGQTICVSKNKRDGVYNLMLNTESAQALIGTLYYEGCLALDRKISKAKEALSWVRPEGSRRVDFIKKRWTNEEDSVVLSSNDEDAARRLGRTLKSVSVRRWRLTGECAQPEALTSDKEQVENEQQSISGSV